MPKRTSRSPLADRVVNDSPLHSEEGFRAFFDEHYEFLWRFLRHLGVSESKSEDLIQDALFCVYRRRDELDVRNALAYVMQMLRNAVIIRHRHDSAERHGGGTPSEPIEAAEPVPAPGPSAEEAAMHKEQLDLLRRAVGRLPPQMRRCFVLRYHDDLSHPEISERLGIAEGTVKAHLHSAREKLKKVLGSGGPT